MSQYCDVTDIQNLFPATNAGTNAAITKRLIPLASSYVENFTRRVFTQQQYTEVAPAIINNKGELVGRTRQWPITAVSALSYQVRGSLTWTPLDVSYIDFSKPPARFWYWDGTPPSAGQVLRFSRYAQPIDVQYTYTAGYSPIPDDIKMATALICQSLMMFDINPAGASSISVSSAAGSSNSLSLGKRSIHLDMAEQILQPYVAWE